MRQATLVALYGDKPEALAAVLVACQRILAARFGDAFAPASLPQVHSGHVVELPAPRLEAQGLQQGGPPPEGRVHVRGPVAEHLRRSPRREHHGEDQDGQGVPDAHHPLHGAESLPVPLWEATDPALDRGCRSSLPGPGP